MKFSSNEPENIIELMELAKYDSIEFEGSEKDLVTIARITFKTVSKIMDMGEMSKSKGNLEVIILSSLISSYTEIIIGNIAMDYDNLSYEEQRIIDLLTEYLNYLKSEKNNVFAKWLKINEFDMGLTKQWR